MNNEDLILQKLTEMQHSIDELKHDVIEIKEKQNDQSTAVNTLLEWADDVQVVVKIPFAKG